MPLNNCGEQNILFMMTRCIATWLQPVRWKNWSVGNSIEKEHLKLQEMKKGYQSNRGKIYNHNIMDTETRALASISNTGVWSPALFKDLIWRAEKDHWDQNAEERFWGRFQWHPDKLKKINKNKKLVLF